MISVRHCPSGLISCQALHALTVRKQQEGTLGVRFFPSTNVGASTRAA